MTRKRAIQCDLRKTRCSGVCESATSVLRPVTSFKQKEKQKQKQKIITVYVNDKTTHKETCKLRLVKYVIKYTYRLLRVNIIIMTYIAHLCIDN